MFYLLFRSPETRPKSPEKPRDYVTPAKSLPAAGKPSRKPEDKPTPAAGKPSRKPEDKPTEKSTPAGKPGRKTDEKPTVEKSRPAAGKPSRSDSPEKLKSPEKKPHRGDQSPDSLDGDKPKTSAPVDVLKEIPLKEQCICELCTCGLVIYSLLFINDF